MMSLKIGDKWHNWTVDEVFDSGLLVLHSRCPKCGCPKGMEIRTTERGLKQRQPVTKSHECIVYLRQRLERLEQAAGLVEP